MFNTLLGMGRLLLSMRYYHHCISFNIIIFSISLSLFPVPFMEYFIISFSVHVFTISVLRMTVTDALKHGLFVNLEKELSIE